MARRPQAPWRYRLIVSLLFGLAGFLVNFLDVELIQNTDFKISILAGLLFPLLVSLAWGWRWGLLSSLAGGAQTMWWLWRGDGWGFLYAVPVFTLWIVWHGWAADCRRTAAAADPGKASPLPSPLWLSPFLLEIPFRLVIESGFFTLFPWLVSLNPPPWNPEITWTAVSANWIWTVVIKHTVTGYILLLTAYVLLQLTPFIRLFRLPAPREQADTTRIYAGALLAGILVWLTDALLDSLFFHRGSFLDSLLLDVPPHEVYIRSLIFLSFLIFGSILARATRKTAAANRREKHLNRVLAAIRNVNQLITKETDRIRLMDQACQLLIETRGYRSAWICLLQKGRPAEPYFHAGFGEAFQPMTNLLAGGELPPCARRALSGGHLQVVPNPREDCWECPLSSRYAQSSGLTIPLTHQDHTYGWLSVATPRDTAADPEEQDLLKEVAGDIAYALASLEREAQRRASEDQLRHELEEKEILLKEVHHRVKNNLQMIISLIHMQSAANNNPQTAVCLEEALNRIRTIADVHEQLYHSESLARIDAGNYLARLAKQLIPVSGLSDRAAWQTELPQCHPEIPMETAIPLGLIVNELVTNSLKHAFPGNKPSPDAGPFLSIRLSLAAPDTPGTGRRLRIIYRDNGTGLPPGFDPWESSTLGFKLIANLTEQLQGNFQLPPPAPGESGIRFVLELPLEEP